MMRLKIPRCFWTDHAERGLPSGKLVGRTKRHFIIEADLPTWKEILSDAEFYSDTRGFCYEGRAALAASARATAEAIHRGLDAKELA